MKKSLVAAAFLFTVACQPGKAEPPPVDLTRPPTPPASVDASAPVVDAPKPDAAKPDVTNPGSTPPNGNTDTSIAVPDAAATDVAKVDVVSADAPANCRYDRGPADGKIEKSLLDVYASGAAIGKVAITYKRQVMITPMPMCPPSQPTCSAGQALQYDLQKQAAEIQRCVIARIATLGGEFLETLTVATVARLTLPQAQDIAALTDVTTLWDFSRIEPILPR